MDVSFRSPSFADQIDFRIFIIITWALCAKDRPFDPFFENSFKIPGFEGE